MMTPAFRALLAIAGLLWAGAVAAHGMAAADGAFIASRQGMQLMPYLYLGAKHMVTGYDHLLFLFGVIFFLYRLKDISLYVSVFALGHSCTLLFGVLNDTQVNPYLIDAVIGLSVVYKALDNLGAWARWLGTQPDTRLAVLIFGLFHGFGLATKLQDLALPAEGLIANMLAFNLGVELGQLLALAGMLIVISVWRRSRVFVRQAFAANVLLMAAGFLLTGYQLAAYFLS